MGSSDSEFNLECSGVIKIANLKKVLSALDEEDEIEVNFGGPAMETSPLQIEKFIEGVGGTRRIQAKEKRDSEKWYYKPPNGKMKNISGFPNPNFLKCLEYTIHAGIKRAGYLKIGVVGFREDIEIKKESSLFAGRININIKKQLPGEGLNKKALEEAAVEIFEIYELVDK
jgi:hypothetical protein